MVFLMLTIYSKALTVCTIPFNTNKVSILPTQCMFACIVYVKITLVNTQNVSVNKTVDSSSSECAESKYGLRIQFLALVVMIHEVWLNA